MNQDGTEIISAVIECDCIESYAPDGFMLRGDHVRAAFLDLLAGYNPEISKELHETRNSYTVSPVYSKTKYAHFCKTMFQKEPSSADRVYLLPEFSPRRGNEYCIRVTILGTSASKILNGASSLLYNKHFWMGDSQSHQGFTFKVKSIDSSGADYPVSISIDDGNRIGVSTDKSFPDSDRMLMLFMSPTTFRQPHKRDININMPFPLPDLVFMSIFESWLPIMADSVENYCSSRDISGVKSLQSYIRDIAKDVRIAKHEIRTEAPRVIGNGIEIGFVGYVVYDFGLLKSEDHGLFLNLGFFSIFSGVGSRRSMGMGQTIPLLSL